MSTLTNMGSIGDVMLQSSVRNSNAPRTGTSVISASVAEDPSMEAARAFEKMMIHNMLKAMRKTTMAEDTSNGRELYDDMLDEHLAQVMTDAGGLGVARAIARQLDQSSADGGTALAESATADVLRLRTLIERPVTGSGNPNTQSIRNANIAYDAISSPELQNLSSQQQLNWVNRLWSHDATPDSGEHNFITPLLPHAERNASRLGTSPNAILAIAALETGWGKHVMPNSSGGSSHNFFGIKANSRDSHAVLQTTTEYVDGQATRIPARFRTYKSPGEAVDGFATFLLSNPRYSTALAHAGNPERFLQELQNAGYATDPAYADKAIAVMRMIEQQRS